MLCSPKSGSTGMLVLWDDETIKEGRSFHKEVPIDAGGDSLCFEAGGGWQPGGRGLSQDGDGGADLPPMEEEIRQHGSGRDEAVEGCGRREREAEAACGRFEFGQAAPLGCPEKKGPKASSDARPRWVLIGSP